MKALSGLFIGLASTLIAHPAYAQDDTFTQVGSWSCDVGGHWSAPPPPPPVNCAKQNFPQQFGGTPTTIVQGCPPAGGCGPLSQDAPYVGYHVDATGFSPYLLHYGRGDGSSHIETGTWVAVGPKLATGTVVPNYLVLTVIYAPPGTNGGHSTSSVSYQTGSTTGTTTSSSQTFKVSDSISAEGSGGFLGNGGGVGISFEYARSTTDTRSIEIKKSTTATITRPGPAQDGINHDEDQIWLLLKPNVNLALSSSSAAWIFGDNSQSPVQYVLVGWLNGHQPMPPGVQAALQSAGITPSVYPDILSRDPLAANPSVPLDPKRFQPLNTTFPYEPPYLQNDPVPTTTFNISDSSTTTNGTTIEDTFKVGLTISTTGNYLDFAKATLKDTATWQWTNKSSQSTATGSSQSATVTIGGPAFGYTGPTVLRIYYDTLYKTFAFAILPVNEQEVSLQGTISSQSNKAPDNKPIPVLLTANGTQHRTFTDPKGKFTFFGQVTGPAKIEAQGVTESVTQALPSRPVTVHIQ